MAKHQLGLFAPSVTTAVQPPEFLPEYFELGEKLPPRIRFGSSSWSYPGWAERVYKKKYPETLLAREGLMAYGQHPLLRAVGIDRTYYAPLDPATLQGFADSVPDDFRFLSKAHEWCTVLRFPEHERYGKRRGERNPFFLDPNYATDYVVASVQEGLGSKCGPIVFQFSPMSIDLLGDARKFAEALYRFLSRLPKGPHYAVELRTPELLCPDYVSAIKASGASHCFNAWFTMTELSLQMRVCEDAVGPGLVGRWMLPRRLAFQEARNELSPYAALTAPDPERRMQWCDVIATLAGKKEVTITIDNKAEGCSPLSVVELSRAWVKETGF